MKTRNVTEEFQREWEAFLSKREHKIGVPEGISCVLVSHNGPGKGYRWLLVDARGKSRSFNRFELEDLKRHLRRARAFDESAYVVVRFGEPLYRVLVIPAEKALKRKRVLPTKGGIPWFD